MAALLDRVAAVEAHLTELSELSLVIPVFNEEAVVTSFLESLQDLRCHGVEVILVDGGSHDATCKKAANLVDTLVTVKPGRARQMNAGAHVASGNYFCFLHADTCLPSSAAGIFSEFMASGCCWGRFDVRLSGRRAMFTVIAKLINWRSRLSGIATGDQALFMSRDTFTAVGGFPDIPLMEDVAISRELRKICRPYCSRATVTTSSRRWQQKGVWPTIFLMWKLRWLYFRGRSPEELHRQYYGAG